MIQAKNSALQNDLTTAGLESLKGYSKDPVGFMTWVQGTDQDILSYGGNAKWSSELQHRTLIFFTIIGVQVEQFFESRILYCLQDDPHIKYSKSVLIDLAGAGGISGMNQVRAREIVENFLNKVLKTSQLKFRPVSLKET